MAMFSGHRRLSDTGGPMDSGGGDGGGQLSRNSSTRGSLRKVLPSVPDMDQQLTMAAKMIDRRTSTPKGKHSYSPYFLEYNILAEYQLLLKQKIGGVYVVPSAASSLKWFGVLFIRQGIYAGGVFRFILYIPENYPDGDVPTVELENPVFHPLVHPETGRVDIKRGFANKWRRNVNYLWHVILYLRRCFYKIETNSPLNPEAAVLYDSAHDMFLLRAQSCVEASIKLVYDLQKTDDPHAIVFSEYQPAIHDPLREKLKKEISPDSEDSSSVEGLSWIKTGTLQVMSKS